MYSTAPRTCKLKQRMSSDSCPSMHSKPTRFISDRNRHEDTTRQRIIGVAALDLVSPRGDDREADRAVKARFPNGVGGVETLFVSRGAKLTYRIETREDRTPAECAVRLTIDVQGIRRQRRPRSGEATLSAPARPHGASARGGPDLPRSRFRSAAVRPASEHIGAISAYSEVLLVYFHVG